VETSSYNCCDKTNRIQVGPKKLLYILHWHFTRVVSEDMEKNRIDRNLSLFHNITNYVINLQQSGK
jgi:hypothetical protein